MCNMAWHKVSCWSREIALKSCLFISIAICIYVDYISIHIYIYIYYVHSICTCFFNHVHKFYCIVVLVSHHTSVCQACKCYYYLSIYLAMCIFLSPCQLIEPRPPRLRQRLWANSPGMLPRHPEKIRPNHTLPKTNIGPENWWLEDNFPFGKPHLQVLC